MTEALLADLREEIAAGRVFAIVGAGVSIAATSGNTLSSWAGLLRHGVERSGEVGYPLPRPEWKNQQFQALEGDLDEWLGVAEQVERRLRGSGNEYGRWVRETVGSLRVTDGKVLEAVKDLGVPIATTNYDNLITDVTGLQAVTLLEGNRALRMIRGEEKEAVLHIHGHWVTPDSVVLGIRSYEEHLGNARAQMLQQAIAVRSSILFIGCGLGLDDPNFRKLRDWMRNVLGGEHRHYRLCLNKESAGLQKERQQFDRLFPLPYGATHDSLADFLRSLRPTGGRSSGTAPSKVVLAGLPARPRCLGRAGTIDLLVEAMIADPPRPVPIMGPPGIGKSTASLYALHDPRLAARFAARRYFVRLESAHTASDVAAEIAAALRLEPSSNPVASCLAALATAPAALVLDNFETPWEADQLAAEELLANIAAAGGVALAVSVRGATRPAGPDWRDRLDLPRLALDASRELFLAIAGIRHENDTALAGLLRDLDDLPLAVTLMAHLAEAEPDLAGIAQRWRDERTAMLRRGTTGHRLMDLPVSFELSIRGARMTDEARRLLSLLALLPDGIATSQLPALVPNAGLRATGTLRQVGLAFDESGRLRALAPLREHVRAQHPPHPSDLDRAVRYYADLARLGEKVGLEGGGEIARDLAVESGNIESILSLGLDRDDPTPVFGTIGGWGTFQRFSGIGSTLFLETTARKSRAAERPEDQANCIRVLGDIALARSDYEQASARYEEALPLYRHVGAVSGEASCIKGLGDIALRRSDHNEARARLLTALTMYQGIKDVQGEANCIFSVGDIALRCSDYEEAMKHLHAALALYQRVGSVLGEANCFWRLGDIARELSAHEEARKHYEEALPLYRRVAVVVGEANCMAGLGDIALACSDREQAREKWCAALVLYERVPDPDSIGQTHQRLAKSAENEADRANHLVAARRAWRSIGFDHKLRELDDEFGPENGDKTEPE